MLRSFTEFADYLEHMATTGPEEDDSFERFVPDCMACGESMDEPMREEEDTFECLCCRAEFSVRMVGGAPVFTLLVPPIS